MTVPAADRSPARRTTRAAAGERSLRLEHQLRVRQSLIDAALRLFARQGYDETTTEQVAQAAGVSPRTFFRYFPTKESVLFFGEDEFIRSFTGVYLAQDPDVDDLTAMCRAFVVLAPVVARLRERIRLYRKAVASSPILRGRERENHEANVGVLARAVAERRRLPRPDAGCELLAGVGILMLDRALDRWLRGPARTDLGGVIATEVELLRSLVTPESGHEGPLTRDSRLS